MVAGLCLPPYRKPIRAAPISTSPVDTEYLNFFAQTEGILPSSFFFGRRRKAVRSSQRRLCRVRSRAIAPAVGAIPRPAVTCHQGAADDHEPRSRRLFGEHRCDRGLAGLNSGTRSIRVPTAAISARVVAALGSLDLPTVVFPLQYAPLCEGRRMGAVTYRAWMIASGEVKTARR